MNTYLINIGTVLFDGCEVWHGSIIKLDKKEYTGDTSTSLPVSTGYYIKGDIAADLIREAAGLDYTNDEVIFAPTMERLFGPGALFNSLALIEE